MTAKHVVKGPQDVLVTSADGREALVDRITVPDPAMDMALLDVSGPIVARGCSSSTLGRRRLDVTLAQRPKLTVEIVENGARTWFPAKLISQDGVDSSILVLQTGEDIAQTYSGAPVVEDPDEATPGIKGTPVAMIVNRQPDGRSSAIRFDRIKTLVEPIIRTQAPETKLGWRAAGWSGRSDPACPPSNILRARSECGWKVVRWDNRPIWIEIARDETCTISRLDLRSTGISKVLVETSSTATGDTAWVKSCRMGEEGGSCTFGATTAKRVRLSFVSEESAEVSITAIR